MGNGINTKNLGYKVTVRKVDWSQLVRETEGDRWNLPQANYILNTAAGQRVFVTYDWAIKGPDND